MRNIILILVLISLSFAGPTLDDFWAGNASWTLDANNIGAQYGIHFPSMMWEGSEIWCYYIKHQTVGNDTGFAVGRARSTDGLNWTDDGFVFKRGGEVEWGFNVKDDLYHLTGSADGEAWSAGVSSDDAGFLCYGPYTTLIYPGPMDSCFAMMIDDNTSANDIVVTVDVFDSTTSTVLASLDIRRQEFGSTTEYSYFHLNFIVPGWNHSLEFRTYWHDIADIKQLSVTVAEGHYPHWDGYCASFPGIFKDNGQYFLVYEGSNPAIGSAGDIGLAMSADGLKFHRHEQNPILTHNTSGWEEANIGTPTVFKEGSVWYLLYHGFDWTDCQNGIASGTDILNLTKYASNPTIPTVNGTFESGTTGRRSTLWKSPSTGLYYMAYECSTEQPYPTAQWSTCIARSQNKYSWEKYASNPIIPISNGFGNDGPELIVINGTTYLYVRSATGGMDRYRLQ